MDNNLQKKAIESSVGHHRPSEASYQSEDEPDKTFIKKLQHWRLRVGQGRMVLRRLQMDVFMFN
jgi:hypothetical protein